MPLDVKNLSVSALRQVLTTKCQEEAEEGREQSGDLDCVGCPALSDVGGVNFLYPIRRCQSGIALSASGQGATCPAATEFSLW